jgi:ABC-type multidrug transport system ATPase subunit
VQNLSGGNKRKLSSAIAFLGKPSVVVLDEPSTGMDPGAKRFLWNIIRKARDLGMTVLLSSHSMEESEALCDKMGIMMSGQLQCFGSINHIKEKYGDGYRLVIKCKHNDDDVQIDRISNLEQFILNNLENSFLEDKQYETLFFKIKTNIFHEKIKIFTYVDCVQSSLIKYKIQKLLITHTFIYYNIKGKHCEAK